MKRLLADGAARRSSSSARCSGTGRSQRTTTPSSPCWSSTGRTPTTTPSWTTWRRGAGRGGARGDGRDGGPLFTRAPYERLTVRDAVLRARRGGPRAPAPTARVAQARGRGGGRARGRRRRPSTTSSSTSSSRRWSAKLGHGAAHLPHRVPGLDGLAVAAEARRTRRWPSGWSCTRRAWSWRNGFSELTDAVEQRRAARGGAGAAAQAQGRPVYPLDERFLEAVGRMPPVGGHRGGARSRA